ncbi:Sulfotransferase 1C4 [Armadillidium nasatum]|uniref:Sulfotransferase 1C4 n=1 Tax=Armadillidium nasatum TaxID=96803 RepID=A0A5N5SWW7_9CRUS|nr:Sulfotransferase 1C4 [Armadillidium nasatum]
MAGILPSGHTYKEISEEETERLTKKFSYLSDGGINIQPGNSIYAKSYLKFAELIYNFEVREDDIFINTVAKSGTNWIAEIVWNLVHNPDMDNPEASLSLDYRYPFFDVDFIFDVSSSPKFDPEGELVKRFKRLCPGRDYNEGLHIQLAEALPDPRLLKGHTPLSFWNPNVLEKAKHVRLAWEKRNNPNLLFLFYEDLKENPKSQIKKVDQFIGTNRSDKQIDNIVHCTSFDYMKKKSKENSPLSFDGALCETETQLMLNPYLE